MLKELAVVAGVIVAMAYGWLGGTLKTELEFREEAFKRGYMVECLGKTGYHWECEDGS